MLVGDVGGTNARLALCDVSSGEISVAKTYSGLDYPSLEAVVRVYLEEHKVSVEDGCIAIACDYRRLGRDDQPYPAFSIAEMKRTSTLHIWKSSTKLYRCRWPSRC